MRPALTSRTIARFAVHLRGAHARAHSHVRGCRGVAAERPDVRGQVVRRAVLRRDLDRRRARDRRAAGLVVPAARGEHQGRADDADNRAHHDRQPTARGDRRKPGIALASDRGAHSCRQSGAAVASPAMRSIHLLMPVLAIGSPGHRRLRWLAGTLRRCGRRGQARAGGAARWPDRVPALPRRRADARRALHDRPRRIRREADHRPAAGRPSTTSPTGLPTAAASRSNGASMAHARSGSSTPTAVDPRKLGVHCRLKPICDITAPSWLPNGTKLVLRVVEGRDRTHGGMNQAERVSIAVFDPRNGEQRNDPRPRRLDRPMPRSRRSLPTVALSSTQQLELVADQAGQRPGALRGGLRRVT